MCSDLFWISGCFVFFSFLYSKVYTVFRSNPIFLFFLYPPFLPRSSSGRSTQISIYLMHLVGFILRPLFFSFPHSRPSLPSLAPSLIQLNSLKLARLSLRAGAQWRTHATETEADLQEWDIETYSSWMETAREEERMGRSESGIGVRCSCFFPPAGSSWAPRRGAGEQSYEKERERRGGEGERGKWKFGVGWKGRKL